MTASGTTHHQPAADHRDQVKSVFERLVQTEIVAAVLVDIGEACVVAWVVEGPVGRAQAARTLNHRIDADHIPTTIKQRHAKVSADEARPASY